MNRKEFTNLLLEWRGNLLSEIKIKDFKRDLVPSAISDEDFSKYIFNISKGKFKKPFTDNLFLQIVYNSYQAGQNHTIQDFISLYDIAKQKVFEPFATSGKLEISVPGEQSLNITSLEDKTYNDIEKYVRLQSIKNTKSSAYKNCIDQGPGIHFEIIDQNQDWIITYPKTQVGSISLARSFWNGDSLEYDETFDPSIPRGDKTGVIEWCTSVSGATNMFINYHVKMKLHMYYVIKKNTDPQDRYRKVCVSITKKNKQVEYYSGHASVDANNNSVTSKDMIAALGEDIYNSIINDTSSPKRPEIDPESYYTSINFQQYLILRKANEESISDFVEEAKLIVKHSVDKDKIMNYINTEEDSFLFLKEFTIESSRYNSSHYQSETLYRLIEVASEDELVNIRNKIHISPQSNHMIDKTVFMKTYKKLSQKALFDDYASQQLTKYDKLHVLTEEDIRELYKSFKSNYHSLILNTLLVLESTPESIALEIAQNYVIQEDFLYKLASKSKFQSLLKLIYEDNVKHYHSSIKDSTKKELKALCGLNPNSAKKHFDDLVKQIYLNNDNLKTNKSKYVIINDPNEDYGDYVDSLYKLELYPGFSESEDVQQYIPDQVLNIQSTNDLVRFLLCDKRCTKESIDHWDVDLKLLHKVVVSFFISTGFYNHEYEVYDHYPSLKEIFSDFVNENNIREYIKLILD